MQRMKQLGQEVEPAAAGLDPERLARLDRHFARYVDDGRLAGYLLAVARGGQVAHFSTRGWCDKEAGRPVESDTLWRMHSMTKPITSVAAMMLNEEGLFELTDPIARYLPAFAAPQVYQSGEGADIKTRPAEEPVRIWHLLTHTAGLTHSLYRDNPVAALYRTAGLRSGGTPQDMDLAAACDLYAGLPLQFEPGSEWNYSIAANILGRLIEVVSGKPLDEFLAQRIFGPLGMSDAGFFVGEDQADRLAAHYGADKKGKATRIPGLPVLRRPQFLSGGAGLIASALDYHRFMEMLRRRGELDGVRLLGPRTVDYMVANHLPGNSDIRSFSGSAHDIPAFDGVGFGFGMSVTVSPVKHKVLSSVGEFGWSGAESTTFWVNPREDVTVQFMTNFFPSTVHPIIPQLKQLVQQAIVD